MDVHLPEKHQKTITCIKKNFEKHLASNRRHSIKKAAETFPSLQRTLQAVASCEEQTCEVLQSVANLPRFLPGGSWRQR